MVYIQVVLMTSLLLAACSFDSGGLAAYDVAPGDVAPGDASPPVDARGDGPIDGPAAADDADAADAADAAPDLNPSDSGAPPWVDPAWTHRKRITVHASKVTAALTDFPLLVSLTADADLAARAQNNGDDLLFCAADGTTKLSHEIERFNDKSGLLVAWVKLPALSATSDTTLFMYYGGAGGSGKADPAAVFASGYEAVWHLHHDPSKPVGEATGQHPGTSRGGMKGGHLVAGKVGRGFNFDGNDDAVDVGVINLPPDGPGNNGLTLEAWVRPDQAIGRIISKATGTLVQEHWWMASLGPGATYKGYHFRLRSAGSTSWTSIGGAPLLGQWMQLAFTYDGASMRIYKDGKQIDSQPKTGKVDTSSSAKVSIGDNPVDSRYFDGILDEVRLSRVARSAAWLAIQYANQNGPASFYTLGKEEQGP